MLGSATCVPCRKRKVRCYGGSIPCTTCSRSRLQLKCSYAKPIAKPGARITLPRGEACVGCRESKKRCDAGRPACSICKSYGKENECIYRSTRVTEKRRRKLLPPQSSEPASELVKAAAAAPRTDFSVDSVLSFLLSREGSTSASPSETYFTSFDVHLIILEKPVAPLALDGIANPLAFALSTASSHDLNMTFRIFYLIHRFQYMTHFSAVKYRAVLQGDFSGTVVHPFFVHFANLAGCHIYQQHRRSFCMLTIEAVHLQLTLAQLENMEKTAEQDPPAFALANQFMAIACFCTHRFSAGLKYMKRCVQTLKDNNIRFRSAEHGSEGVRQGVTALVSALYTELLLQLVFGRSEGGFYDIEEQFREQLPFPTPLIDPVCPLTKRLHSLILLKDAHVIVASFKSPPPDSWVRSCQSSIAALTLQMEDLRFCISLMENITNPQEHDIRLQLRYGHIICLTAIAELCELLGNSSPPLSPSETFNYKSTCRKTLEKVVGVTRSLSQEDLNYFDPFIGACWMRAARLISRIKPTSCPKILPETHSVTVDTNNTIVALFSADFYTSGVEYLNQCIATLSVSVCVVPPEPRNFCDKLAAASATYS